MSAELLLVGPASVDRYLDTGESLPGGGALNMAYHWARAGAAFRLITRVCTADRSTFEPFFVHHDIAPVDARYVEGLSCSVDVTIREDRQPWMDNFVDGVWSTFEFTSTEIAAVRASRLTHLVLVDAVDAELLRTANTNELDGAMLSGDFLSLRHFDDDRFARSFAHLAIGFVGWPGMPDDPKLDQLAERVRLEGNVLVITCGSKGVRVADGRPDTVSDGWFSVDPVEVVGSTVGCGDAFIATFLNAWIETSGDVAASIDAGRAAGAAATRWWRPLPDEAYAAAS